MPKVALAQKLKQRSRLTIFHATMLVTRTEEWWVEAQSAQEAQALLSAGQGHRCAAGECVHVELESLLGEPD